MTDEAGLLEIEKDRKTKTAVICPVIKTAAGMMTAEEEAARENEAAGLVLAMGQEIVFCETVRMSAIVPKSFFGKGTLERLRTACEEKGAELLVVDMPVSAVQQRNLEKMLNMKVIDRTAVILEIFGQRAQTREGKLQVELAHLTYQRGRLVRSWTHLERQRGGGGFLGGPGETQIELDRRHLDERIVKIKKELQKVKQTRALQRNARQRVPYPVVALVGYTNAGKSSLFNRLAGADVFAKDLLFATLDPTMRRLRLPSGREIILSDTVGFISDLPHELIMAFRATLEEVLEADLIVHVRDIANPNSGEQKKDVLSVLDNLGLKEVEQQDKYIEVLNKTDLLTPEDHASVLSLCERRLNVVPTSAVTGEGTGAFLRLVEEKLSAAHRQTQIKIPAADGRLLAWIYSNSEVLDCQTKGENLLLNIKINAVNLAKLEAKLS
mgnify:FL=1